MENLTLPDIATIVQLPIVGVVLWLMMRSEKRADDATKKLIEVLEKFANKYNLKPPTDPE